MKAERRHQHRHERDNESLTARTRKGIRPLCHDHAGITEQDSYLPRFGLGISGQKVGLGRSRGPDCNPIGDAGASDAERQYEASHHPKPRRNQPRGLRFHAQAL